MYNWKEKEIMLMVYSHVVISLLLKPIFLNIFSSKLNRFLYLFDCWNDRHVDTFDSIHFFYYQLHKAFRLIIKWIVKFDRWKLQSNIVFLARYTHLYCNMEYIFSMWDVLTLLYLHNRLLCVFFYYYFLFNL